jgi:hypothetical protein
MMTPYYYEIQPEVPYRGILGEEAVFDRERDALVENGATILQSARGVASERAKAVCFMFSLWPLPRIVRG